ncbi:MAG: hypothetical protein QT09_C0008G0021 [archaeon GW2011_AR18]|nr:MAG: hypothetical protein QT09_C0008G0021 [archaeon GW2011_AR18]
MTEVFSRNITTNEHLKNYGTRPILISFYERSGSLIDILRKSTDEDGSFPILVSDNVDKKGRDYVVSLPKNQVYVASRECLVEGLSMETVADMIDSRAFQIKGIVDRLTPVTIDIVGDGKFASDGDSEDFLVFSNPRRAVASIVYNDIRDLVRRKKVKTNNGKECYLNEVSPSALYLNLDHNFRVGDEESNASVGGVKIVLEKNNLYVGVGIYVDSSRVASESSGNVVLFSLFYILL